jgi:hypothetical protein
MISPNPPACPSAEATRTDDRIEIELGVSGGAKVGQWSGGIVPLRGGVITGHWLV